MARMRHGTLHDCLPTIDDGGVLATYLLSPHLGSAAAMRGISKTQKFTRAAKKSGESTLACSFSSNSLCPFLQPVYVIVVHTDRYSETLEECSTNERGRRGPRYGLKYKLRLNKKKRNYWVSSYNYIN